jgi:asparagine synthase (glutamine-hydrolysing)
LGKIRELLRWSLVATTNPLYELYKDDKYFDKNSLKWFNEKINLCLNKTNNLTEATRYYYLFFGTMGDNFLTKTDRTTMYYGLEARSPFCDYRWIEFASKIPTKWKVSIWGGTKLIMLTLIKDIIPKKILHRKKQGFTPPFFKYIKQNEQYILKYIKSNIPKGILPRGVVSVIDDKKQSGEDLYFDILLKTYLFTLWYKKWIKN